MKFKLELNKVPASINHIDRDLYGAGANSQYQSSFSEIQDYLKLWSDFTSQVLKDKQVPDFTNKIISINVDMYFKVDRNRDVDNYFAVLSSIIFSIPSVSQAKYVYIKNINVKSSDNSKQKLIIHIEHIKVLPTSEFPYEVYSLKQTPSVNNLIKTSLSKFKNRWLSDSHSLLNTQPKINLYIKQGTKVKIRFFLKGDEENFKYIWFLAVKKIIDGIFPQDDYKHLVQVFPDFAIDKVHPRTEVLLYNESVKVNLTKKVRSKKDYHGQFDAFAKEALINWLSIPKYLKGTIDVTPGYKYMNATTFEELADHLQLSRETLYQHLTQEILEESHRRSELFFKTNVSEVWGAVLRNAMGDSFNDRKMFLEKYGEYVEKKSVDVTTRGKEIQITPDQIKQMGFDELQKLLTDKYNENE